MDNGKSVQIISSSDTSTELSGQVNEQLLTYVESEQKTTTSTSDESENFETSPAYFSVSRKIPHGFDWESLDPDSNLYIANLPSDFGNENLAKLFGQFGEIARHKFVSVPSQRGYGFVQYVDVDSARRAIQEMDGYKLENGEQIYMSVALRRRSSLSEEPTNLYLKNVPIHWTNGELNKLFSKFGRIVQSRVAGDGIAFVRYETHQQALLAIDQLYKTIPQGCNHEIEIKFANRKRAVNSYNTPVTQEPPPSNKKNLYIRGLPPSFGQVELEKLFSPYGTVSSTRIFDNGVAFVRYAHAEDAYKVIERLNENILPGLASPLTVKLAYFDIGDGRNRTWKGGANSQVPVVPSFSKNVFQQHFDPPNHTNHTNSQYGHHAHSGHPLPHHPHPLPPMSHHHPPMHTTAGTQTSAMPTQQPVDFMTQMQSLSLHQPVMTPQGQYVTTVPTVPTLVTPIFITSPQGVAPPPSPLSVSSLVSTSSHSQMSDSAPNVHMRMAPSPSPPVVSHQAFTTNQRRQGDIIYQHIAQKYSKYAGKVTGMILNLGEIEAERLIENRTELDIKVEEAVNILRDVEHANSQPTMMSSIPMVPIPQSSVPTHFTYPQIPIRTTYTNPSPLIGQ